VASAITHNRVARAKNHATSAREKAEALHEHAEQQQKFITSQADAIKDFQQQLHQQKLWIDGEQQRMDERMHTMQQQAEAEAERKRKAEVEAQRAEGDAWEAKANTIIEQNRKVWEKETEEKFKEWKKAAAEKEHENH